MVPSPQSLGLPFTEWRPNQVNALRWLLGSVKRVKAFCASTGFGKTGVYVAYALITNVPTCIVTDNRGLQRQLMDLYERVGLVSIMGKRNYLCDIRPDATCEEGYQSRCPHRGTIRCPNSFAEMRAATSPLVVTNYAKWTSSRKFGQGMSHFQQVVLDEGHKAPDALALAMQVTLGHRELCDELRIPFPTPSQAQEIVNWKPWASVAREDVEDRLKSSKARLDKTKFPSESLVREVNHLRYLVRRLAIISTCNPEHWIVDEVERGYQFDPIRPGRYAEAMLLLRLPSVLVVSATLRPKTLYMLGIPKESFDFQEYASDFDPKRSPIYYVPTMRVDKNAGSLAKLWIKLDQIAAPRRDRKGIVHTISYARREEILACSRFAPQMLVNPKGEAASRLVDEFKASPPGTILVSPSVGEGYDFPGCVSPTTRILTADLRYVEAHTLKVGDKLLGFDDFAPPSRRSRQWRESTVTANRIGMKDCLHLSFDDGSSLTCSSDHPLLRYGGTRAARWKIASKLRPHLDSVARVLDVWGENNSWWAGYLAGIWDGEGHLSQRLNEWRSDGEMPHVCLGMCQVNNVVLEQTVRLLWEHDYHIETYPTKRAKPHHQDKVSVLITNRREMLRFLGECRPIRLLAKLNLDMLGSLRPTTPLMVRSNTALGRREVSLLSTSTGTYVSEGLASHNTECEWQFVCKIPFPDGRSKIIKARQEDDKEYGPFQACSKLEQIFGRGTRTMTDQCENFIGDEHLDWFLPKYKHLFSRTFHARFRRVTVVPPPPERL